MNGGLKTASPGSNISPIFIFIFPSSSSLRELPPLDEFPQLYGLRLAGNRYVMYISRHYHFRGYQNIQQIYIFYLFRLRNISENAFELSSHIKMLNLADNLLEHIDQAAFEPLKRLKGKKHVSNKYDMNILLKILFFKCFVPLVGQIFARLNLN